MKNPEYKTDNYEDNINLYDYIKVIWRWKFIIIGIVILSVIAALVRSYMITPVYRVTASLSPGAIEELDPETMKVELVPVAKIDEMVSFINGGIYNPKIFNALNIPPFVLQFTAKKHGEAYIINVSYDTTDPEQGEIIMRELLNQIEKSFSWKITSKIDKFKEILNEIVFYINQIKLLKDAETKIRKQIKMIDENTESIIKQRDRMLSEGGKGDPVALLLYSNTIQQNIAYKDTLNTTLQTNREGQGVQQKLLENSERNLSNQLLIMEKLIKKPDIGQDFSEFISRYDSLLTERPSLKRLLEKLKEVKSKEESTDVKLIHVVQEPFASSRPIRPRRTRMVMISGFVSLFLGFFLALIVDFIRKSKDSSK
jgi:uncharacterized protein involved in exopolysaccharide biosynthesis